MQTPMRSCQQSRGRRLGVDSQGVAETAVAEGPISAMQGMLLRKCVRTAAGVSRSGSAPGLPGVGNGGAY